MKTETLQTLTTARVLMEQAERHCNSNDRYLATAGLIVLQDAVELILLAVLLEREVDEKHNIEKFSFDEMLSAVAKTGIKVPKSGTLKAMNKLRVTAKHYGQMMEPSTVLGHLHGSKFAMDEILLAAVGKRLREIFLSELVGEAQSRNFLDSAVEQLQAGEFFEALVLARKAFHEEFERDYCIYEFRIPLAAGEGPWTRGFRWEGGRSPDHCKDAAWIKRNVKTPFDYIQIDHEKWRVQAIEWGIGTRMLYNVMSLTPSVIRLDNLWYVQSRLGFNDNQLHRENAALVLDLVIEAIRRKQEHARSSKFLSPDKEYVLPPTYQGFPILEKAATDSRVMSIIKEGDVVTIFQVLDGFTHGEQYYSVFSRGADGRVAMGFVKAYDHGELLEVTVGSWMKDSPP